MNERYRWVPDRNLTNCPEVRFIASAIVQAIQDAQRYSQVVAPPLTTPAHNRAIQLGRIAQWVTTEQFQWWCEILGVDPVRLAWHITLIARGQRKISTKWLRKGVQWDEYEKIGLATIADPVRRRRVSLGNSRIEKYNNAKAHAAG